jgi:pimeloyl-ACP methyl ester carboxylesterase
MHEISSIMPLSDGTRVSYATYGDPDALQSLIYFHGFPGSRFEGWCLNDAAQRFGVRVLALERPGYGQSTSPTHTLAEWPRKVFEFCDRLNLKDPLLFAVSGGVPFALACLSADPQRFKKAGLVSGVGAWTKNSELRSMMIQNRLLFVLARHAPIIARRILASIGVLWSRSPGIARRWLRAVVVKSDQAVLSKREVMLLMDRNLHAALQSSCLAVADDFLQIASHWPFSLSAISTPIILWHGMDDSYVPPVMSERLFSQLPHATLRMIEGQGHFMVIEQGGTFLKELLAPSVLSD